MMPLETEQRPQDTELESDSCRNRLLELQGEFRKMEEMVANMRRYKAKIDQLKQENASLKFSYEVNLQKYCNHIGTLERDNVLVRNHVKKMEAQLHGKGDDRDKSKLLLERLRMVEAENSSLVLENEQQRQQYEKCLDEIANQVVQALLAQKTLREECFKLQSRVQDLEMQNKHLNIMFQQRMMVASECMLQIRDNGHRTSHPSLLGLDKNKLQSLAAKVDTCQTSSISPSVIGSTNTEPQEHVLQTKLERTCPAANSCSRLKPIIVYKRRARSLEDGLCGLSSFDRRSGCKGKQIKPESHGREMNYFPLSRLEHSTSVDNIDCFSDGKNATLPKLESLHQHSPVLFNISVSQIQSSNINSTSSSTGCLSADKVSPKTFSVFTRSFKDHLFKNSTDTARIYTSGSVLDPVGSTSFSSIKPSFIQSESPGHPSTAASLASQTLALKGESTLSQALRNLFENPVQSVKSVTDVPGRDYYYDYSDEDSDARLVHGNLSTTSTVSLSELLNYSLDRQAVLDDDVFSDWSTISASPKIRIDNKTEVAVSRNPTEGKLSITSSSSSKSRSSFPEFDEAVFSTSSMKVINSMHMNAAKEADTDQTVTTSLRKDFSVNKSVNGASSARDKDSNEHTSVSEITSRTSRTRTSESTAEDNPDPPDINLEVRTVHKREKLLSSSLNPTSQDTEHGSKGNNLQSAPSMSKTSIRPWHEPTSIPETYSILEPLTRIKNQDTKEVCSRFVSNGDKPCQGTKLTRPGQLILAPEEKNFNFQGFSSGSSTSSEDTSPLKIFESKQNCDMKSSVIEVKQDGTFVHAMRSIEDSNSETSTSLSVSPSSPANSPTKIPASKVAKMLKPMATSSKHFSPNSSKDGQKEVHENTNITVGFLFQFPTKTHFETSEHFINNTLEEPKNKIPPGQPQYFGGHVPAKCQSSDSSFENLRVERSGSKDDGYSTMSSDIHPEILEKFGDTLTRKPSTADIEPPPRAIKNVVPGTSVFPNEARRMSDPAVHAHDRSFDLMSDPDSALETSVHSTAEMVTSSSSQVSTSSSDYPLSPCPSNVSKIARILDGDNTKLHFVHGSAAGISCKEKENCASSSSKSSGSSMSPVSPNTFVPSCYQPPESPRRLTNEFQKSNTVRCPSSSSTFRKLSPGSPKTLNKSFGGFSLKQKQQASGIPIVSSNKKSLDTKLPSSTKPQVTNPTSPNGCTRLPKKSCSSAQEGLKNTPISLTKGQGEKTAGHSSTAGSETANHDIKSGASSQAKNKNTKTVLQRPTPQVTKESASRSRSIRVGTLAASGKHLVGKNVAGADNIKRSTTPPHPRNPAGVTGGIGVVQPGLCKTDKHIIQNNAGNSSKSIQNAKTVASSPVSNEALYTSSDSKNAHDIISVSDSGTSGCKHPMMSTPTVPKITSGSSNDKENNTHLIEHTLPRSCSSSKETENVLSSSSQSILSSTPANRDIPHHQSHLHHHHSPAQTTENRSQSTTSATQKLKQYTRIVTTNHGFQQISDTENNEDEPSSITSALVYDTVTENANGQDINCDRNSVHNINNCNNVNDVNVNINLPQNVRDVKCNSSRSNIPTTNDVKTRVHQRTSTSDIPCRENVMFNKPKDIPSPQTLPSSNKAHATKFFIHGMQHPHADVQKPHTCMQQPHDVMQQPYDVMQQPHAGLQQPYQHQYHGVAHHNRPANSPPTTNHCTKPTVSNKIQCLHRSKSENDLSVRRNTPSIYDQFFWVAWDSGKILERSASLDEVAPFSQRSWVFDQGHYWAMGFNEIGLDDSSQLAPDHHYTVRQQIPSTSSPPSTFLYPCYNHFLHQEYPHLQQHQQQHHYHQHQQNLYPEKNIPLPQTLRLDLSDVTELDEERSEQPSNSMYSSNLAMTSDESPSSNINEQKAFNCQFYSLCKVDSNRSLLSSGKESRKALSQTELNEIINRNLAKSVECISNSRETSCSEGKWNADKEMAVTEFDEISRQIASLSKTVDELNQSLSSLNSGEFEPSSYLHYGSSHFRPQEGTRRANVIDGFHWVDEDIFLSSSNRGMVMGCAGTYADICTHNHFNDLSSTEDASSEFYQFPLHEHHSLFHSMSSAGQDEIFARTLVDTVKERQPAKRKQRKMRTSGGSDVPAGDVPAGDVPAGDVPVCDVPAGTEHIFSSSELCKNGKNEVRNEGGDNGDRKMKLGENKSGKMYAEQAMEHADKLASSNNESDDSLASDIGLDRMMCQRLFGRKGCLAPGPGPIIDTRLVVMRYEDPEKEAASVMNLHEDLPGPRHKKLTSQRHVLRGQGEETISLPLKNVKSEVEVLPCPRDCHRETRDVGIDVMSHSQISLNSFDIVDLPLPDVNKSEILYNDAKEAPDRHDSFSTSQASSNRNIQRPGRNNVTTMNNTEDAVDFYVSSNCDKTTQGSHALRESRPQSLSHTRRARPKNANTVNSLTSHSDCVADLNKETLVAVEEPPPKLPPRQPIISNTMPRTSSIQRDIAPLPPPPACLDNERYHPSCNQHQRQQSRHHFPYVNQHYPTLPFEKSKTLHTGQLHGPALSVDHECTPTAPPPVPPRLPPASRSLENRSVNVRNPDEGSHSLIHYRPNKSRAALTSSSITSASSLATYPGPKSQNPPEKLQHFKRTSSMEKSKDDTSSSKIPRRRFKTKRTRSRSRMATERPSLDTEGKLATSNGKSACKQWRDIDLVNGLPLSDSSCEDDSS